MGFGVVRLSYVFCFVGNFVIGVILCGLMDNNSCGVWLRFVKIVFGYFAWLFGRVWLTIFSFCLSFSYFHSMKFRFSK